MDKLLERLGAVLSKEDLDSFKTDVEKMVNERVAEEITKASLLIESQEKEKSAKVLEEEKSRLETENKENLRLLEEHLVSELDICLENLIDSDFKEALIDDMAVNESLSPAFAEIKTVVEKYVTLDENAKGKIEAISEEKEQIKADLSEAIEKNIALSEGLASLKKKIIISEAVASLNEYQKESVEKLFADKDYDFTEKNLKIFVSAILENKEEKKVVPNMNENTDLISPEDKTNILTEEIVKQKNTPMFDDHFLKTLNSVLR